MELTIAQEKDVPLLKRKSITARAVFGKGATPSSANVRKAVAEELKVEEKRVAIKKIAQQYGSNTAMITANIYESEDALKAVEEIKKRKKVVKEVGKEAASKE